MASLAGGVSKLVGADLYDAVIRIPLFKHAYDRDLGWPLGLHEPSVEALDRGVGVRVVPIGHFNSGKTWLIRKLIESSDTQLVELKEDQTGDDVHTEGFSVKMAKLAGQKQKCVFLDTAGLNSPVTSIGALGSMLKDKDGKLLQPTGAAKMKAMEEMLEELKRHESFIRHVSFDFAQVFLVVVGQVSHRDQIDLINLIEQASRCATAKEVVVVHNLKRMSLTDFREKADNQTGDTYLRSMEKVFKMASQRVRVGDAMSEVDELFGAFGASDFGSANKPKVAIRHLFLTNDNQPDGKVQNAHVLQRIRDVVNNVSPASGSVLTELGQIMTRCAASMVRLPPGQTIELRAHRKLGRILAGVVTVEEQRELAEKKADPETAQKLDALHEKAAAAKKAVDEAREAGGEPTAEQRAAFQAAEDELSEAMTLAAGEVYGRVLDAAQLQLLDPKTDAVTCKPIPLGGMARRNNSAEKYVKHNVTRVRGWVADSPHWIVSVHVTLPGLAPGQLAKIREQLQWDAGADEFKASPTSDATLQLVFDAEVLAVPDRQKQTLSTPPAGSNATGRINLTEDAIEVIDAGTRPFPTRAALGRVAEGDAEAAKAVEQEQASQQLKVVVQTEVQNAIREVQPVVTYARGILSVTVACSLTDEDERVEPEAWVSSDEAQHTQLEDPENGTNGTDDDVESAKPKAALS